MRGSAPNSKTLTRLVHCSCGWPQARRVPKTFPTSLNPASEHLKSNAFVEGEIPRRYDDGGQSGATLDRPQPKELLADIEGGLVDVVVVVYKLDRITRSLLHFVRLTEFLERHGTSLVSITQMFDSSDSMGRLILSVLLTFAQFEREISSDRLRDKQRLIRQSGRWYGGTTPLGYRTRNRILQVNGREARAVREHAGEPGLKRSIMDAKTTSQ